MKKGVEIVPEDQYRLKSEDMFDQEGSKFGVKGGTQASTQPSSSVGSTKSSSGFSDHSETEFREASKTLYAKHGDQKVGLSDFVIKKVIGIP